MDSALRGLRKGKEPEAFLLVKGHKILAKSVGRSVFFKEIGCDQSIMRRSGYFYSFGDDIQLFWLILTSSFPVPVPFSFIVACGCRPFVFVFVFMFVFLFLFVFASRQPAALY